MNGAAQTMTVRLYGVPGSHPVLAVQLMLELKAIPYVRRDLPNQLHKLIVPRAGYVERTVPVIRIDGERVQGSRRIARALDLLAPEPPLFPADEGQRREVEALEAWGDGELQETARTLGKWAAKQDPSALAPIAAASEIPIPRGLLRAAMALMAPAVLKTVRVDRIQAEQALHELPASLDRADAAIASRVIGGDRPNAADFQVATCVRLLTLIDELGPLLADRPVTELARRIAPHYPGHFTAPLGLG